MNLRQKAKLYKKTVEELVVKLIKLDTIVQKHNNSIIEIHSKIRIQNDGKPIELSDETRVSLIDKLISSEEFKQSIVFYKCIDPFTGEFVYAAELKTIKPEFDVSEMYEFIE